MSNWNWPQYCMLGLIMLKFANGCLRMTESEEKAIKRIKEAKKMAESTLILHTLVNLFECYILAKGGFW